MGILIVEKDNISAELIYEIFIEDVKNLFFTCDCIQASIAFRKYNPSVVIVDLDISIIDVIDLTEIMKTENPKIKIIAIYSIANINDIKENLTKYHIDALIKKEDLLNSLYNHYEILDIN